MAQAVSHATAAALPDESDGSEALGSEQSETNTEIGGGLAGGGGDSDDEVTSSPGQ